MTYRIMEEADIASVIPLYMEYYNDHCDGEWTESTVSRRIRQVLCAPDSYCLLAEKEGSVLGFAIGHFEQYDDLIAYDLVEIVIAAAWQNQGLGTAFMLELERRVKARGAAMVQLLAVNDDAHHRFYDRLNYQNANNLVLKLKFL